VLGGQQMIMYLNIQLLPSVGNMCHFMIHVTVNEDKTEIEFFKTFVKINQSSAGRQV
jgi:hypothetical protein